MATEVLMNKLLFNALVAEDKRTCLELLEVGADPNRLTKDEGIAPIHIAVGLHDEAMAKDITEAILHMGGDPNVRCVDGATPVHIAAMQGRCETLDLLLLHGGDPALLDPDGQTGYDCARSSGCDECMRIMRQHRQLSRSHTMLQTPEGVDKVGLLSPRMDEIKRKYKTRYSTMLDEQLAHLDPNVHQLDVTSPDHPVLVYKQEADVTLPDLHGVNNEPRTASRQLFHSLDGQSSGDASLNLHTTIDTRMRPTPLTSTFDTLPPKSDHERDPEGRIGSKLDSTPAADYDKVCDDVGEMPMDMCRGTASKLKTNVDDGIGYYPDERAPCKVTASSKDDRNHGIGYYPDQSDKHTGKIAEVPVITVLDPNDIPICNHQEMTRLWVSQYGRPELVQMDSELDREINKAMVGEAEQSDVSVRSTVTEDSHVKLNRNISESDTGSFHTASAENSPKPEISIHWDTPKRLDSVAKVKTTPKLHKSNFDAEEAKLEVEEKTVRKRMSEIINDMRCFVENFGDTKENCQNDRVHRYDRPRQDFKTSAKPQTPRQPKRYEQSQTVSPKREPFRTPISKRGPLKTPTPKREPLRTPTSKREPLRTLTPKGEPLKTPTPKREPLKTPTPKREPLRTPISEREPLQTPTPKREPMRTPASKREPLRTPTPKREPFRTPNSEREPLRTLPHQIYDRNPVESGYMNSQVPSTINVEKSNKTPQKFESPKVGSDIKTEKQPASRTPRYQRPIVESVSSSMDESLPRSHSPKPYTLGIKQTMQQAKQDELDSHHKQQQQQLRQQQHQQQHLKEDTQQPQQQQQQRQDGQQEKQPVKGILKPPISNLTYDIISSSNNTCTSSDFARDLDFGAQNLDLSELSREISKLDTAESSDESWVLKQIEHMEQELEREIKQETEKRKAEKNQQTEVKSDEMSEQSKAMSTSRFQDILRRLAEGETLERIERKVEIEPALYRRLSTIFEEKSGDLNDYSRRQSRGRPNESELRKLGEIEREWLENQQDDECSVPDLLKDSGHLDNRSDQGQGLTEQEREMRLKQERRARCKELLEQERQKRTERDLDRSVSLDSSFYTDDSSTLDDYAGDRYAVRHGTTPKTPKSQGTPKSGKYQTPLNDSLASVQSAKSQASMKSQSSVASSVRSQGSARSQQSVKSQTSGVSSIKSLGSVASSIKSQASVKSKASTCSCQSAVSVQTVYKDPEDGTSLLEIHFPPDAGLHDPDCTIISTSSDQADICIQVSINISDESASTVTEEIKVPQEISRLTDEELRQALVKLGDSPGPIVPSTRRLYEERLVKAKRDPGLVSHAQQQQDFPVELTSALSGRLDISALSCLERSMSKPFVDPDPTRKYREGTVKASFIYLLLDPTITCNLPVRVKAIGEEAGFKTFVRAIFYVGKGKRSRPYMHFREAMKTLNRNQANPPSDKVRRILSIWAGGQGVISLHVFQNVIPEEAFTREACIIDAMGLSRLTNQKGGEYYGPAHTWFARKKRQLGVVLLRKAFRIFLSEGERQIKPHDVK